MSVPFFSVIIPLYNKAPTILRAIRSVLGQSDGDFELIVVNDGSTDDGADLARKTGDERVRVVSQKNAGVSAARNRGIAEATADHIALLDADDSWDRDFLEAMRTLAYKYPQAGIYTSGYRLVFPNGPSIAFLLKEGMQGMQDLCFDNYFERACHGSIVTASSAVVPKRVFAESGAFPEGCAHGEDLVAWARIALRHPVAYCCRVLANYHQGVSGQTTGGGFVGPGKTHAAVVDFAYPLLKEGELPAKTALQLSAYARTWALKMMGSLSNSSGSDLCRQVFGDCHLDYFAPRLGRLFLWKPTRWLLHCKRWMDRAMSSRAALQLFRKRVYGTLVCILEN